jgi:cell wall-associated NlpC family hydrolase
MRQIIIDKLFAKAKGLPGTPSKDQLTEAGLYTKVTGAQSSYNTSQLNLTQMTQSDINRGTAAALNTLTKATNTFADMISKQHALLYGYGYANTFMGGMNGAMGTLVSSLIGNIIGPVLGRALSPMFSNIGKSISTSMGSIGGALRVLGGGLGAIATAVMGGKAGYNDGKKHNWNWGSFLTSVAGGAASGAMMGGPWGALVGAVGGGAVYGGGYAFGSHSSGGGYGVSNTSLSVQGATPMAAYALATAASQIGTPYAWGGGGIGGPTKGFAQGAGTVGFDCSSFVQYVFAKQGINLPRTTYYQIKAGQGIDPMSARPGDLLFWGSPNAPHHVAIYAGNGKIIQAPHTGGEVEVASVDLRGVSAARRVLGAGNGNAINWSTVIGNNSSLSANGMSSVPGYNDASMSMANGGVTGAFGTTTSTGGWGTKLESGGGDASTAGGSAGGSQIVGGSSAGNITINVTVPPSTDPKHVKATTKAVVDAVNKTKHTSASRKN